MTTITFDTLAFVKRLKAAGFNDQQAEALSDAQHASLSHSLDTTLATKDDISRVEKELKNDIYGVQKELFEIKAEQKLIKWMLGFILAGVAALILKSFFA